MDTNKSYFQQITKRLQALEDCILEGDLVSTERYLLHLPADILRCFPIDVALASKQYGDALKYIKAGLKDCEEQIFTIERTITSKNTSTIEKNNETIPLDHQALHLYQDPEIADLTFSIQIINGKIAAANEAREEIEKQLRAFELQQRKVLGGFILQILDAQRQLLRRQSDAGESPKELADEADRDYKAYEEKVVEAKEALVFELSAEQQKELKKKYRRASKLCHPDLVANKFREQAEAVFMELKQAYQQNNLVKVSSILNSLKNNNLSRHRTNPITQKNLLKDKLSRLERQFKEIQDNLDTLKNDATYQQLSRIIDWTAYFSNTKKQLAQQLALLEEELNNKAGDEPDWY